MKLNNELVEKHFLNRFARLNYLKLKIVYKEEEEDFVSIGEVKIKLLFPSIIHNLFY